MSVASGDDPLGQPLTLFICQLLLIIAMCKGISVLFRKIKQPSVVAEVVTGIVLGPSVFGYIPNYLERMFPSSSMITLQVISNVGLILFMYLVGLEVDMSTVRSNYRASILISVSSIIIPFGLGCASSLLVYHTMIDTEKVDFGSFLLFVGVALSITAFPVLARILTEYGMLQSKVGATALSAAAVGDVIAWIILAAAVATARAMSHFDALYTFLMLLGFLVFMLTAVRKGIQLMIQKTCKQGFVSPMAIVILLILIFLSAWVTEIIGVHAIFGGFIVGIITPRQGNLAVTLTERFEDVVVVLLLPLYFAYSGLRTRVESMNSATAWGCLFIITSATCVGKIFGTVLSSKILKYSWRESFTIGILMNTKGLVELIVLNIGLDVGVLNESVFTLFVIMALITTFMTTPLLHFVWLRHQNKDKSKDSSGFRLIFYASDPETGANLTTIAKMLISGASNFKITAVYLNEISERPSSYFFRDNLALPQQLLLAQERAKSIGIEMDFTKLNSTDLSSLVEHAFGTRSNMVLLKWDLELYSSVPNDIIQHVSANALPFSVAVLADKGFTNTYLVKKVNIIFTGHEHEEILLQLVKQLLLGSNLHIHILATSTSTLSLPATNNVQITEHKNPTVAAIELNNDADLIIAGVKQAWYDEDEILELVERSPVSVLLMKGAVVSTEHDNNNVELPAV